MVDILYNVMENRNIHFYNNLDHKQIPRKDVQSLTRRETRCVLAGPSPVKLTELKTILYSVRRVKVERFSIHV